MSSGQQTARVWNTRRSEKQRRQASLPVQGKVLPTDQMVEMLEKLISPGDRVVLEGNNQKQADFLSRMLAEVNPQKVHHLHMIMPSVAAVNTSTSSKRASLVSSISPSQARKVCAFRSCWKTISWKSVRFTLTSNFIPVCTSISRPMLR